MKPSSLVLRRAARENVLVVQCANLSPIRLRAAGFSIQRREKLATGIVKFFNTDKGYGFIKPEDGSEDVFVHVSAVQNSGMDKLVQGMRVGFEVGTDKRTGKAKATSVRVL